MYNIVAKFWLSKCWRYGHGSVVALSGGEGLRQPEDFSRNSRVLIDRLVGLTLEKVGIRTDMRGWCVGFFRSPLSCVLDSNPTVNSRI